MFINLKDTLNLNQEFLRVIILSLIIRSASSQTLVYSNFFGDFSYSNDWFIQGTYSGPVSYCGSSKIFGGSPEFSYNTHIIKTFNLPPHYQLRFQFKFWHLDNWGGEYLKVYVDNVEAHVQSYSSEYSLPSICGTPGSSYGDGTASVSRVLTHYSSTAQILINGQENYWGISEFQLLVDKCATGCQICDASKCYLQKLYIKKLDPINFDSTYGWIYGNQNMNTYAVCLDQNYLKSPSSDLTKIIPLTNHDNISLRLKIMTFNSDPHSVQVFIDNVLVLTSNLSKQVYTQTDFCDVMTLSQIQILEYQHTKSTIQIQVVSTWSAKYYCVPTQYSACQSILGISDFELFIHPYTSNSHTCTDQNNIPFDGCFSNIYDCVVGCSICVKGVCIKCKIGWEYQKQQRICMPICGDSIITHLEECDDGNIIPYDGCYLCKFSCQKFCKICKFGKCLECLQSYKMIENKCIYIYNYYDGPQFRQQIEFNNQITNFIENGFYQHILLNDYQRSLQQIQQLDCNQQSYGIFGYYYNQCSIDRIINCKIQLFDICLECQSYYYLQSNMKECNPICGDGVIVKNEICDDQNNFQFDFCYKCQQSCQLECKQCNQSQCYDCIDGWSLINNNCYQICGDGMQAFNTQEQCDDGNYEPYDGCYECKYECDQNCFYCSDYNICMICNQYFKLIDNTYCVPICGDGIIVQGLEDCEDLNDIQYDGCYQCIYQCEINCTKCNQGICQECIEGFELTLQGCQRIINYYQDESDIDDEFIKVQKQCGDGLISNDEQCDDWNYLNNDGCSNNCIIEFGWVCNDEEPSKCYQITNILLSYLNQTYQHQYVKLSFSNLVKLKEPSKDITESLICLIDNLEQNEYNITIYPVIDFDDVQFVAAMFDIKIKIFQPIIDRIINCKIQLFDICLECQSYYYLQSNMKECNPICGDGVIVKNEICDDQNNFQFDFCYKCQQSCQLECKQCNQSQCYDCIDGWSLINNNCYQICGDGMQAFNTQEQCDDGNYEPYDGCYECKYECDQNCFYCSDYNICMICNQYFKLIDNTYCVPICGDGIIVQGLEDCEDLNDIQYDGCYQCIYQCEINCTKCNQGICQECIEGFELTLQGCQRIINYYQDESDIDDEFIKVQKQCGDGLISNDEQCDDWNYLNNDGCSNNCIIEFGWVCNDEEPSKCYQITNILLSYLNQTYQHQYVKLSFSNLVKLKEPSKDITESLICLIDNLEQNEYNITIYPVIDFDDVQFVAAMFDIKIKIFQPMQTQPNLTVTFNTQIIDINDILINQQQQQLLLQKPNVLDSSQLQAANSFQELGNKLMLGLGIISIIMLLFGRIDLSLEILDTLLFQTYLKFINVNYPQNLQIYFESSDFVSINPILINFKISGIFDETIGVNYIQSYGKLSEYQVNADLFTNIKGQILQLSVIVFLLMFSKLYQKMFLDYCFTSKYFYCIRKSKSRCIEFLALKYYQMIKKLLGLKNLFNLGGLRQIFYANSWDLLFKVILFLKSNNQYDYRTLLSYLFSIGSLILVIFFLSSHFQKQNGKINLTYVRNEQHEGVILFKKLSFIIILIVLQNAGAFQCLMMAVLTFSYIGLVFTIKLIKQKFDLFIVIWMEAPVMLFTITSILYCTDFQQHLSLDQQILLGFGQIGILLISLLGPVIRFNYIMYKQIKAYLSKRKQNEILQLVTQSNLFAVVDM
ncbi:unnamed protein product [Paramecium pentaurelia]|uniref:Insulin-like growth factor binding protein, N-terminal n=1 Tax=Paramecium pentaurelia TaxID=43138 RepID=A0A8S1TK07_9CILI|nr:unnamed protein product [Paramecium pentaurelia]